MQRWILNSKGTFLLESGECVIQSNDRPLVKTCPRRGTVSSTAHRVKHYDLCCLPVQKFVSFEWLQKVPSVFARSPTENLNALFLL